MIETKVLSFTEYLNESAASVIEPTGNENVTEVEVETEKVLSFDEFRGSTEPEEKDNEIEEGK